MTYAQIKASQKLHLVYEPGEGRTSQTLVPAGRLGLPLCGCLVPASGYRMTINVPLGHACQRCRRVLRSRRCKEASGGE